MGVVAASAIGLIVIMGTTQSFVQQRISFLALEKRMARLEANKRHADGLQRFMGKDWDCLNTLKEIKLLDSSPYTAAKKGFEIAAVKDSAGTQVWSFAKDAAGELTNSAAKEKLKSFGIDKFERLEFVYETASPAAGRIVLSSKTNIPGLLEGKNPDIVWELSRVKVEARTAAADGAPADGDYVTACEAAAESAENPCGPGVNGAAHSNGGGFVASTAAADSTAYVGPDAAVCDAAQVKGAARIENTAKVYGQARVFDQAKISGSARVYGGAWVFDDSEVYGQARVFGEAKVYKAFNDYSSDRPERYGVTKIFGNARVYGNAIVSNGAQVKDKAQAAGRARIQGSIGSHPTIYGSAYVGGSAYAGDWAEVYGHARVEGETSIFQRAKVYGSSWVDASARVHGNAHVFGNAWISQSANIGGRARISGSAYVIGYICGSYSSGRVSGSERYTTCRNP